MELETLIRALDETGYPVIYDEFDYETKTPPPLPWIVCYETDTKTFAADNGVYFVTKVIVIELYTEKKDLLAERKLESILIELGLIFNAAEEFIEEEKLYRRLYTVEIF